MENEELIRKQMEDTRSSISEKLETLEQKVTGDIQGATGAVTGTVEAVKDTVETVKDSVTETVETVKEAVAETTETVKESVKEGLHTVARWFDVPSHVRNYPLLSVGIAAGAGFLLESTLVSSGGSRKRSEGTAPFSSARAASSNGASSTASSVGGSVRSGFSSLMSAFGPQIGMLRQMALTALINAVKEPVLKAMPTQREGLAQLFDSLSEKLGVESESGSESGAKPTNGAHSGYAAAGDSNGGAGQFGRTRAGSPMGGGFGQG